MHVSLGWLRNGIRRLGYEVIPAPLARLLRHHRPSVVLDIGANEGQFGLALRKAGFDGRIVSFEPMASVFRTLEKAAASDSKWEVRHTALGDRIGESTIYVASNSASSSLLPPGVRLKEHASFLDFKSSENVVVTRLDTLFHELVRPGETVALKVDTQGYEQAVLNGAEGVIDQIDTVLLELSLVPLYENESPAETIMAWMRGRGLVPAYMSPAFSAGDTRRWIQADVLFVREHSS